MTRPWPVPSRPWVMKQVWEDLLFAHWPLAPAALASRIPAELELDLFEGQAWLAVVPFRMSGVTARGIPPLPGLSAFPELNLRTYVTRDGKPGVYFFTLDAQSRLAVEAARAWFHLPYVYAAMSAEPLDDGGVGYVCERRDRRAAKAHFAAEYRPVSDIFHAEPGTLAYWLTERYCLYAVDAGGRIYRGEIDHEPWPLQVAQAAIHSSTIAEASGFTLGGEAPLLHFARRLPVRIWPLERCK
uniref:DUF2071 domain-containing protein n=2 Tax=Paenibacillus athensensis TaxID=1967502 RepID=A0A4Y8QAV4_9BACL